MNNTLHSAKNNRHKFIRFLGHKYIIFGICCKSELLLYFYQTSEAITQHKASTESLCRIFLAYFLVKVITYNINLHM